MTKSPVINTVEEATEHIEDITNLGYLKKYACPKYQHKREWYLECIECKNKNKCKAGQQAIFLMNNATTPEKKETKPMTPQEIQEKKMRDIIEEYFRQPDPVKAVLESCGNIKPQSVYQKVWSWKKNYPDLEEKYQMVEKFRFLWRKPYDCMKIPDILNELYPEVNSGEKSKRQKLYPEVNSGEQSNKEPEKPKPKPAEKTERTVSYTDIAPRSKIFTVTPDVKDDSEDCISLEDFLLETADSENEDDVTEREAEEVSAPGTIQKAAGSSKDLKSMDELLKKLQGDIQEYEAKIKETRSQIEAIKTVQKLMNG